MNRGNLTRHSEALQLIKALESLSLPVKQILLQSENKEEQLESEDELAERLEWLFLDSEIADMLRHLIQRVHDNKIVPLRYKHSTRKKSDETSSDICSSGKEDLSSQTKQVEKRQTLLLLFQERVQQLEKKKGQLESLISTVVECKSPELELFSSNQKENDIQGNIYRMENDLCHLSESCSSFEYFILDLIDLYKNQKNASSRYPFEQFKGRSLQQSFQEFHKQVLKIQDDIQEMQSNVIRTLANLHKIRATQKFLNGRMKTPQEKLNRNRDGEPNIQRQLDIQRKERKALEEQVVQLAIHHIQAQVRHKLVRFLEESYKRMQTIQQFYQQHLFYKKVQSRCIQLTLRIASTRKYLLEDVQNQLELLGQCLETETEWIKDDLECRLNSSKGIQIANKVKIFHQNTLYRIAKVTGHSVLSTENIFPFLEQYRKEIHDAKESEENILKKSSLQEIQKQLKQLVEMLQGEYIWEPSNENCSQRIRLLENKETCIQQDVDDILATYAQERQT
ncbi:hypothetical protein GAYE_PCTG36G0957 [Galdieria yellowstonensis]|uniref:HAUS augmin-like complex subunit 3 N-terminal domain-containing protein n=1 Tax=Galdieria yellowstonensis TaxID=3028027 RepID=A0AAV9I463_9RHOD|nr:hypothetical protein GAYE_PCTG36G0957 [Galdieria yellowstonensis]